MSKAADLANALGRPAMAETLGVGGTAISNAVVNGRFPAAWFDPLERLALERGVALERDLFAWRRPESARVARTSGDAA